MSAESSKFRHRRLEASRGYLTLGMPEASLRELRRIQGRDRCHFQCLLLEGEALRDLARFDDAIPVFQEALDLDLSSLQAFLGLAWCYKRIDRIYRAIETLEEAKHHHPEEPVVIYNLACYFSLAGDKPRAIECLGRSLRMEPQLRHLISEETDFDRLRTDPDFRFVAEAVGGNER